ncbi:MAG: dihydrolipoyl dehydrogenase [Betaproteobacteria bacterium]|nr:dihydrolipoyl dehydrogenase [Betaproteobacteria bacterium]
MKSPQRPSLHAVETDVAVIGAGTAGLAAYRAAKAAGKRALIVEAGPHGTTCARVGCMPSKLLIAPAEAAHTVERFAAFGLAIDGSVKVDGRAVMARVKRERDRFVGFVIQGVDAIPEPDRIVGRARFADAHTLRIDDRLTIRAASIVIATGSSPAYPPAWHALGDRLVTNDQLFEWDDLPESVAVFGPGVIGLELGQALHRLGVRVKVFGRGGGIGPLSDPALVAYARRTFGAEFYLDSDAHADVARDGDAVVVTYRALDGSSRVERFAYLLAATGRTPNVHGLGLEHTGLALGANGVPVYDRHTLRCGRSHIYIAGDANHDLPLLHEAADEGRIAGENAARHPDVRAGVRRAGLGIVFSDPQIAVIGGGHAALRGIAHVTGSVSFEDQGRSRVMLRHRGLLHVYAETGTGRFLGAEMIGPDAEHIGHLLAWALQMQLTVAQMLAMPFYHPVVQEGLRTALRDAQAKLDAAVTARAAA